MIYSQPMTIEEQVTSLELSKKLKELGVKQESLFYWKTYEPDQFDTVPHPKIINFKEEPGFSENSLYSAFTVAELGMLFADLGSMRRKPLIFSGYIWKSKQFSCRHFYASDSIKQFDAPTEADARAEMLIYLLEKQLLTL